MEVLRKIIKNPSAVIGFIIMFFLLIICLIGPLFIQSPYSQNTAIKLSSPGGDHLLGTDEFGRDVLSRLVVGARYSISVGFFSVILALMCGLLMGSIAGYFGKIWDKIIMAFCDILLAFPSVLLSISIAIVLQPGIYTPMLAVGISSIPLFTRLVRAQFMTLRDLPFIDAIRSSGAGDLRIIFFHLFPNSMGPIIVQSTLRIGSSILLAATLNFLGLGAQPPTPEWGSMLNNARPYLWVAPYLGIFPGLAITITVIGFNLIGDTLRDYLDPRMRTL